MKLVALTMIAVCTLPACAKDLPPAPAFTYDAPSAPAAHDEPPPLPALTLHVQ